MLLLFAHGGVLWVEFHSVMSEVGVPSLCLVLHVTVGEKVFPVQLHYPHNTLKKKKGHLTGGG